MVWVRHSSLPVRASLATMTQASGPPCTEQARPEITLPLAMIGPELGPPWVRKSVTGTSQTWAPVLASMA